VFFKEAGKVRCIFKTQPKKASLIGVLPAVLGFQD
jgi:hypothetical protein